MSKRSNSLKCGSFPLAQGMNVITGVFTMQTKLVKPEDPIEFLYFIGLDILNILNMPTLNSIGMDHMCHICCV